MFYIKLPGFKLLGGFCFPTGPKLMCRVIMKGSPKMLAGSWPIHQSVQTGSGSPWALEGMWLELRDFLTTWKVELKGWGGHGGK